MIKLPNCKSLKCLKEKTIMRYNFGRFLTNLALLDICFLYLPKKTKDIWFFVCFGHIEKMTLNYVDFNIH